MGEGQPILQPHLGGPFRSGSAPPAGRPTTTSRIRADGWRRPRNSDEQARCQSPYNTEREPSQLLDIILPTSILLIDQFSRQKLGLAATDERLG